MFDEISLKKIDAKYFNIILLDNKDITLQSRNTGHYWYLHCTEYPEEQSLIIFHKHFFRCPYHQHGNRPIINRNTEEQYLKIIRLGVFVGSAFRDINITVSF